MDAKEWADKVDADNQKLLGRISVLLIEIERLREVLRDIIELSPCDENGRAGCIELTARDGLDGGLPDNEPDLENYKSPPPKHVATYKVRKCESS